MDLFLDGIPLRTKTNNIIVAIAAIMHAPPVHRPGRKTNFAVQVFRKKKSSVPKRKGKITIESEEAGRRFLDFVNVPGGLGGIPLQRTCIKVAEWSGRQIDVTIVEQLQNTNYEDPTTVTKRNEELQHKIPVQYATFGRMVGPNHFNAELKRPVESITASVDDRELAIGFNDVGDVETSIRIHFSSIDGCIVHDTSLYFFLETTPRFLKLINEQRWQRCSSPALSGDVIPELTYVGTTLELSFSTIYDVHAFAKIYGDLNLPSMDKRNISSQLRKHYGPDLDKVRQWLPSLHLSIAFELEILLRRRILLPQQLWSLRTLIQNLSHDTNKDPLRCIQVFRRFEAKISATQDSDLQDPLDVETVFEDACATYSGTQFPHFRRSIFQSVGTMQIYHATVTPTSLFVDGPNVDQSNATIRRFPGFEHHFLRVSFWEEHGCRLQMDPRVDLSKIINCRFGNILKDGLGIAGRHFSFLGYSSSALRDHATWFVTPFVDVNGNTIDAQTIIRESGRYRDMSCPARYGARLAQNFTASSPSVTLEPSQIVQVEDRISKNRSVMTDGCGSISPALLEEVAEKLHLVMQPNRKISAIQFRLGGYKGVLVRNESLLGKQIVVRPSMSKFDGGGDHQLHIVRPFICPQILYLNRTLIQQLEGRGVPTKVFEDLQETYTSTIKEATASIMFAAKIFSTAGLGDDFGMAGLFRNLHRYMKIDFKDGEGEYTIQSRFMRKCLSVVLRHVFRDLKHHARIPVEGSWTLVGVSDEHDCLEEGEIYVTIRTRDGEKIPLLGNIAISRSPQEHPGDIQMAQGIHRDELAYLENVVVFSCKGNRSLPSCLGGGDLDGDEYNIIMNRNLHPPLHVDPASYIGSSPRQLDKTCTIDDIGDFVLEYFVSDLLGLVALRRLHIADQSEFGTLDPRCIKLGELASRAVDYPKTGVAVDFSDIVLPDGKRRPDFMSPEGGISLRNINEYIPSKKALGVLFRQINLKRDSKVPAVEDHSAIDDLHSIVMNFDPTPWGLEPLAEPSPENLDRMIEMFEVYSFQLRIISRSHDMSRFQAEMIVEDNTFPEGTKVLEGSKLAEGSKILEGTKEYLSEAEVIVGSILHASNDRRKRQNLVQRLNFQTRELFSRLKEELFADVESRKDQFQVAFTAYRAGSLVRNFGRQSFQLFALSCMLSIVREIDEERIKIEKEMRRKIKNLHC